MAPQGQYKGSKTGWARYLNCVIYERDGIILYGLYLSDRHGTFIRLHPVQLHGRKGTQCRRCMLNEGYFVLVDDHMENWFDPQAGAMRDTDELLQLMEDE